MAPLAVTPWVMGGASGMITTLIGILYYQYVYMHGIRHDRKCADWQDQLKSHAHKRKLAQIENEKSIEKFN